MGALPLDVDVLAGFLAAAVAAAAADSPLLLGVSRLRFWFFAIFQCCSFCQLLLAIIDGQLMVMLMVLIR